MKLRWTSTAAAALLAGGALGASNALAQKASSPSSPWHIGISLGQSEFKEGCPGGFSCDDKDTTWRLYGGRRFGDILGGEIGYVDFGEFDRGGGKTKAEAVDFAVTAGFPFGPNRNWSVFGKFGGIWAESDVSAAPGSGLETGSSDGFGFRWGLGLQAGLTPNWAIRADWDRYRVDMPSGDEDVDTLTLGVQYTFR